MPLNRIYSTALWLLYIAGAPLLTAALALITIPLLLTDVRAGIILLLLPGVLTLAPLLGAVNPGNVPRDAYIPAIFLGAIRVLVPAIIFAAWFSYFEGDAREGQALLLVLIISAAVSLVLWAWSVDQALTVAPYLDSTTARPVVARRVEIQPALEREERKAMLAARERRGRIDRAISSTRPPQARPAPGGTPLPGQDDKAAAPAPAVAEAISSVLDRFRRKPGSRAPEPEGEAAPAPASSNGATPDAGAKEDVFTGRRKSG